MFEKIWNAHLVHEQEGNSIVYIDRHLVHEVTSPQAFDGIRMSDRSVLHPELTYAVPDHNVPTKNQDKPIEDPISALQVETCLLYTSPSPRDRTRSRMPSSA